MKGICLFLAFLVAIDCSCQTQVLKTADDGFLYYIYSYDDVNSYRSHKGIKSKDGSIIISSSDGYHDIEYKKGVFIAGGLNENRFFYAAFNKYGDNIIDKSYNQLYFDPKNQFIIVKGNNGMGGYDFNGNLLVEPRYTTCFYDKDKGFIVGGDNGYINTGVFLSNNSGHNHINTKDQMFDNINVKLPVTFEVPFPMGKLVTTVNENGTVSQYSLTNCESCNMGIPGAAAPTGFCQICKGAKGKWLYGGMWNPCSYCNSTGYCRTCHGTGQKKISYYQDKYGTQIGVDMNGNVFLPTVGSNEPGYRSRTRLEKVGEKIYEPGHYSNRKEWCEKCNINREPHAHINVYNVVP